ncbi:MAG: site-specific integrase [Desulfobacteraceae bacterium]|nr:site-specific integrase [Desulfobacteraceae bacterium]
MPNVILSKVEEQINSYLNCQTTQALAKKTQGLYTAVLQKKLGAFCMIQGITDLTEDFKAHMEAYTVYLLGSGLNAYSTQQYLTITKIFLNFLGNPVKYTFKIPRQAKQDHDLKHQKRWFTDLDIARCKTFQFKRNHERNHILVRLMCETGARVNEIANIKRGDIQLEKGTILLGVSKTIPRPVFFSQETGIYLARFLDTKFPDPAQDSFKKVFPCSNQIWKIINGMLVSLGMKTKNDGRGPHTFRHFVATDLHFVRGMDLTDVAFLLGDTPETISSRYLHPNAEMLQNRMKKASGWS